MANMTEPRIYRASSLGYSLERLVAPHLGYEPLPTPDWLQEKFNEGNEIEPKCLEKLRGLGWEIDSEQKEVNLEIIPGEAVIQGHLDGIARAKVEGDVDRVVEIKSMNAKTWEQFHEQGWDTPGLVQKYKWQASAYMLATGLALDLVAWNKATGGITIWAQSEPFYLISDLANKVLAAEQHIRDGVIPEDCSDYPCPYAYLHAVEEPPEPADEQLDELLADWLQADIQEKSYKRAKDDLRLQIIEYVGEFEASKVKGSQGVVVSTNWVPEKEVAYMSKGHWETRVTGPRKGKG